MNVLIKPVITEKSLMEAAKNRFTFEVALSATKPEIKRVVEDQFGVHVLGVATIITHGKTIRTGKNRRESFQKEVKKAIVTLKAGETISYFEQKGE